MSEKDNRARMVEAQLLDQRITVKVPSLPESYPYYNIFIFILKKY